MNYVIVGNGVACIGAIEGIRQHDKTGPILVISDEDKATYGRPLISYYLARKVRPEDMSLRPESFYERNNVTVKLGTRVASIDTAANVVTTDSGEAIPYGKLLLATGGSPNLPGLDGVDGPDVHSFTTWADADALKSSLEGRKKCVVIGAGLIALKATEALSMLGHDVTLVVRSRIMRAYFDETAGALIEAHLEKKGIKFQHGQTPKRIVRDANGRVTAVETGIRTIPADLVIMAIGVNPNMELAQSAGITVHKGIVVDNHMRTSNPDVFAAGDVAEAQDILSGQATVTPIWPNAYNQGVNAGINMAGADTPFPGGLSMNSVTFFGLATASIGLANLTEADGAEVKVVLDEEKGLYRKLVFQDDTLVGCILVGEVDNAGIYTSFIHHKLPLDAETRRELLSGEPSPLYWPHDFFAKRMSEA